jgi:NDP-sugar pyrophosphorylase family protein
MIENQPLGTGGAVANAVQEFGLDGSFLVANADTWLGDSIKGVRNATEPALAVIEVADVARYGAIRFDKNTIVTSFVEKEGATGRGWINAGMYHLHADLFTDWDGKAFSLEQVLFPRLVEKHNLRVILLQTEFIDIGIPEDYQRFNRWIETERILPL